MKFLFLIPLFPHHTKVKVKTFNIQNYEQEPSTFKRNNKNLQHSKAKPFNLFKSKDKKLQPPRTKTKALNLFKSRNKNKNP
jgi:hypothetical protein